MRLYTFQQTLEMLLQQIRLLKINRIKIFRHNIIRSSGTFNPFDDAFRVNRLIDPSPFKRTKIGLSCGRAHTSHNRIIFLLYYCIRLFARTAYVCASQIGLKMDSEIFRVSLSTQLRQSGGAERIPKKKNRS